MGVDLGSATIFRFYPLLYWPMDPREKNLSPQALSRIADYMRNGGTILFDTRDLTLGAVRGADFARRADLAPADRRARPAAAGTGAGRSCADQGLLYPARFSRPLGRRQGLGRGAAARAQEAARTPARGGDGVSPVIIGGNDWAAAWAVDAQGASDRRRRRPAARRQREMAIRFGINLVMYALTGNYKTDQVHVPALLERLGQ